ncbi:MAG: putative glycoside hydrolase [Candidatus Uhrbacteria bacterium]
MLSTLAFMFAFSVAGVRIADIVQGVAMRPSVRVDEVRAVYLTSGVAAGSRFDEFLHLIGTTEVNAFVIDLKDANGRIAFRPITESIRALAPTRVTIRDLPRRIDAIHARGGLAIARLPVFQDTWYAEQSQTEAIKQSGGTLWRDGIGGVWLDPASEQTWLYAANLAQEAAAIGFDEVNIDYVRFPSDGPGFSEIEYPYWDGKEPKREVVRRFLEFFDREVRGRGIAVSADIFGLVAWAAGDLGIGQHLETIAPYVDVLAPMVYPSHYRLGFLGKKNPAEFPYEVIRATLDRGHERLAALPEGVRPSVRPWLQDFQLGAPYGEREVRLEQEAGKDAGSSGWMLWNPRGNYTLAALQMNPAPLCDQKWCWMRRIAGFRSIP